MLTAGRSGFFFLSPEKEAKRAGGGGKLAAPDCLSLWTPPAPPLALNRLLCSPPAPRRGDPFHSASLVCPCAGSNPHPATAPADAPAHDHYRWVQHSHAPAQPPPHPKNAALLAAAPQPIRSGVRRICGGLLPLKAEIQATLRNLCRQTMQPPPTPSAHAPGDGGNRPFDSPQRLSAAFDGRKRPPPGMNLSPRPAKEPTPTHPPTLQTIPFFVE